ncbi:MAG: TraR/DksA C4-type zinc finger protein [Chloroflexota bacterium]|nr:TraR/DksA C4-type zinc finger protein [Chloroflexota bacterium]
MRAALRREIVHEVEDLGTAAEARGEDTTLSQHPADAASDLEIRELLLSDEQSRIRELQEVDAALERIDRGTYGICVDCGGSIPEDRLRALPQAARDTACARVMASRP